MFGHNNNNIDQNTIIFCRKAVPPTFGFGKQISNDDNKSNQNESNPQQLFLLSNFCEYAIFDNIPKKFAISTKNNTCYFNTEMIKEVSPIISGSLQENPNELHYFLNISDEENVLSKFEKLFLGKAVSFDEDEIPTTQRITKMLKIKNCPNYLKPESLRTNEFDSNGNSVFSSNTKSSIVIYQKAFINYLNSDKYQIFKIKTQKKEYKCSIFGIYSSKILHQLIDEDLNAREYFYDFEDEYNEFQSICDFFNFKKVDITSNNMDSLKEIAEDLQINCIIKQIDNYISNYETTTKKIDEQQTIIDSIDQLFDLLYNIKNLGLENVKISILQSKWTKSEENVQELAAFILQIVKPSFLLQTEMVNLLIQLDKEANETNNLEILLPFIVDKLMTFYMPSMYQFTSLLKPNTNTGMTFGKVTSSFGTSTFKNVFDNSVIKEQSNYNNRCIYCFIRLLYKKGIIPKEEILEKMKKYNCSNRSFNAFFLPEIIEANPKAIEMEVNSNGFSGGFSGIQRMTSSYKNFVKNYYPDKIDLYERMLDNMEPDDELTKSIIHDDVDTMQQIITRNEIDVSKFEVPYNIFDDFDVDVNITNYAAMYGSLKCFKYLVLNNGQVDQTTLYFAVYGGNVEIIKIVDQRCSDDVVNTNNTNKNNFTFGSSNSLNSIFWFNNINSNNNNNKGSFGFGSNNNNLNEDDLLQTTKIFNGMPINTLNFSNINNIIAPAIALHRNDLFDWIFERKFVSKGKVGMSLDKIAILSATHGNAHALIEMIDKGFDISLNQTKDVVFYSANNGFCKLTQLLMSIIDQKTKTKEKMLEKIKESDNLNNDRSTVCFGNLSIFKLFNQQMNLNSISLNQAFLYAIDLNYKKIVDFCFDNFNLSKSELFINTALSASFKKKTDDFFNFLIEKFKKINPKIFNLKFYSSLLVNSCSNSNFMATKTLTEIILAQNPQNDFSAAFIEASSSSGSNICQYFIDKKVYINYEELSSHVNELGSISEEIFQMIINNVSPNIKHKFFKCIRCAIQKKNKNLIEFLLKQNAPMENTLFEAALTHDLEIVDMILKYNSKPSFINEKTSEGTAIHVAVMSKDYEIVKRLLSIPGIDPFLVNQQGENVLTSAIHNLDYNIIDSILELYGDKIKSNIWILNSIFQSLNGFSFFGNNKNEKVLWKIVKRFMEIDSIDPNYMDQCTFLYKACLCCNVEMVEYFLSLEKIDVNKYDLSSYETPLIAAICKGNERIIELLINYPKTDLNLRNLSGESALFHAVKKELPNVVDLLVKNERFDPIESRLNYAFIFANAEISKKLAELSFLDVNEVCVNMSQMEIKLSEISALTYSIKTNDVDKIDLILNHPSFDKNKSDLNKAIFIAAKNNNIDVFRKLIKIIDNDVNIRNKRGESLLVFAAQNLSGNIIEDIFQNPNFDPKNDQIRQAFTDSFAIGKHHQNRFNIFGNNFGNNNFGNNNFGVNNFGNNNFGNNNFGNNNFGGNNNFAPPIIPNQNQNQPRVLNQHLIPGKSSIIEIMTMISDYDDHHEHLIDFTKLLPDGKSFFTCICMNFDEIKDVSNFLLQHGVDPNMPDEKNVYPLQKAISLNSLDFVDSLINSGKLDFNPPLKNKTTFLHLAAQCKDSAILRILLDKNIFDINSEDAYGNTPLIDACKKRNIDIINLLFENNNLDYLHCNKNGFDALALIKGSPNEDTNAKRSKQAYKSAIISLIPEPNPNGFGQNFNFNFNNNNNREEEEDKDDATL